jgi:Tfp pilus assembly protein PilF
VSPGGAGYTPAVMKAVIVALLLAVASSATAQDGAQDDRPVQERLQRGEKLVEDNCGDCIGSTGAGLQAGIAEIEKAIADGHPDRLGAYKVLAGAYNTLGHVFAAPGSTEQKAALDERRILYEKVLALAPADVEARFLYADTLSDPGQKLEQYRKVLALQPEHADARFGLGAVLLDQGKTAEALPELRRAFAVSHGSRADFYGKRLIEALRAAGHAQEAAEVARQLAERIDKE